MVRRGRAERVVSHPLSSVIELSDGSDDEGTQRSPVAGPGRVRRRSKGGSTPLGSPAVRRRRLSGGVGGGTQAVDLTLESDGEDEDEVRLVAEKGPVDLTHLEESPPREPWTGLPIRNVKGTPEREPGGDYGAPRQEPQSAGKGIKCVICMDVIKSKEMASTTCGHVFCYDCIRECLNHTPRRCPQCRKSLRPTQVHRLYV
mmetsp:Transcript_9652/g.42143  ORF Transcript_9652/g.42143 Transcript_9652/m.42143 type:complete len:201 (+) Transcript_9652:30-632(+)